MWIDVPSLASLHRSQVVVEAEIVSSQTPTTASTASKTLIPLTTPELMEILDSKIRVQASVRSTGGAFVANVTVSEVAM